MIPISIQRIVKASFTTKHQLPNPGAKVDHIIHDSRHLGVPSTGVFFALKGSKSDGHTYIKDCYNNGVRNFVISDNKYIIAKDANFILVDDTLTVLQNFAKWYRSTFNLTIIGITGSSGKTIVKEWLSYMLSKTEKVVKSPKSYNSQLGVALSLFELGPQHKTGIIEAGISRQGEMDTLQKMIQPLIGIFTNIGSAHSQGFDDLSHKIKEKLKLFAKSEILIYCKNHKEIHDVIQKTKYREIALTWAYNLDANIFTVIEKIINGRFTYLTLKINDQHYKCKLQFTDDASIENALHAMAACIVCSKKIKDIIESAETLFTVPMRMEVTEGVQGSNIIIDTYNHDITSLRMALQLAHQNKQLGGPSIAIISDFVDQQVGPTEQALVDQALLEYPVDAVWWVGNSPITQPNELFADIAACETALRSTNLHNATILLKGARKFAFENLKKVLQIQQQSSCLSIDLHALDHNIQYFYRQIKSPTDIIAVIKAGAYGTGSERIGRLLQYRGIGYLAVAHIDEGISLRQAGIAAPIMILNPDHDSYSKMVAFNLQPEVYSLSQLRYLSSQHRHTDDLFDIHLKLDTGMNRLGFKEDSIEEAIKILQDSKLRVVTVFSHMVASESSNDDDFSFDQHALFLSLYQKVATAIGYEPKRHFVNTSGISRFKDFHYDYVRLGIGMYGIDTTGHIGQHLEKVHRFTATIIQIKKASKGESVGYNRKGILERDSILAIINTGYADGLPRAAGNGNFGVWISGAIAPIIGNVCMDLTIIDVTDIPSIVEGDEVEIFGPNNPIEILATACHTIPYEILTNIAPRVRRVWFAS